MASEQRFRLMTDDDGHWYIVPDEQHRAFSEWVDASRRYWDGDAEGEEPIRPGGVIEVGGSPSTVTFTDPIRSER